MIRIRKIMVKGSMDVDVTLTDIKALEAYRKQLVQAYQVPDQEKGFEVSFVLESDNFDEVKWPSKKSNIKS